MKINNIDNIIYDNILKFNISNNNNIILKKFIMKMIYKIFK